MSYYLTHPATRCAICDAHLQGDFWVFFSFYVCLPCKATADRFLRNWARKNPDYAADPHLRGGAAEAIVAMLRETEG